jgi:hypothetical protein
MRTTVRLFHVLLAALTPLALLALAGCAGLDSPGGGGPPAEAPAFRVGDRWVYNAADGFRAPVRWEETREVIASGADGIVVRVTQRGPTVDSGRTERWTGPGRVAVGAVFDDETRHFTPALERYAFPLLPGKSWNQWLDNFNESTDTEGKFNRYVRAGDWERVTTPAGTFDAIRLRVLMRLDDEEFWRYPTECNYLLWYAPAVRGIVREEKDAQYLEKGDRRDGAVPVRSQHAVLELASFTPGP